MSKEKIILLGSGGHAKSVIDTIESNGDYEIVGFLEVPEKQNFSYKGYKVIGVDDDMGKFYKNGVRYAFLTMGFLGGGIDNLRKKLFQRLKETGYQLPVIMDRSAVAANDVVVEEGTFIGKNAILNAGSHIGKMCIINSGAIIEHECLVGEYSHVAVGAVLCGDVSIGKSTLVGANAMVLQGISVGDNATIGAGSVVLHHVEENRTVVGNPAGPIK